MTEAIEILQRQREWCKSRGKTLEAHSQDDSETREIYQMTTPFYTSPEPTKVCTICGGTFEYKHLVSGTSYEGGVRPLCKPCRSVQQTAERRRREKKVAEMVKAEAEKRKAIPNLVPPRTFNHLKDTPWDGKQEAIYIRNSGLKHIPSKGMPT